MAKSSVVLQGKFQPAQRKAIGGCGLPMTRSAKYPRVLIGHVMTAAAFSEAMGETQCRASLPASFPFSLIERVHLLQIWVLPVLVPTAGAHRAGGTVVKHKCEHRFAF